MVSACVFVWYFEGQRQNLSCRYRLLSVPAVCGYFTVFSCSLVLVVSLSLSLACVSLFPPFYVLLAGVAFYRLFNALNLLSTKLKLERFSHSILPSVILNIDAFLSVHLQANSILFMVYLHERRNSWKGNGVRIQFCSSVVNYIYLWILVTILICTF